MTANAVKTIYLIDNEQEFEALKQTAGKSLKKDRGYLRYRLTCSIFFLIFLVSFLWMVYSIAGESADNSARYLLLLPAISMLLPVVLFVTYRVGRITEVCEGQYTYFQFYEDRIEILGRHRKRVGQGKSVSEDIYRDVNSKYVIPLCQLKGYLYEEETGIFRWILDNVSYPDIIVPKTKGLKRIFSQLDEIGIRRVKER